MEGSQRTSPGREVREWLPELRDALRRGVEVDCFLGREPELGRRAEGGTAEYREGEPGTIESDIVRAVQRGAP
jgi:hypothetical protein